MSTNVDLIKSVINGDESVDLLLKHILLSDIESEVEYMLKIAYKIGHRDARHDAAELIVNPNKSNNVKHNEIMNIKPKLGLR